jgi:lipopolysaccharide export system permease protein
MLDCFVNNNTGSGSGHFDDKVWPVALPEEFSLNRKVRASDLTWEELGERRTELLEEADRLKTQIALATSKFLLHRTPLTLTNHVKNLRALLNQKEQEVCSVEAEMQMRPALSMGCLCFVLIGCPVGIWFSRSDYLSAFITCFLPIVFLYYPILLCGTNFAKGGTVDPALALWSADALMGLVALVLFRRLLRN